MNHATFKIGDLTAVIGDNSAHKTHRAGYNGVWSLRHKDIERDLFVPYYTGLNLEHIFSGVHEDEDSKVFMEPRNAAMTFKKKYPIQPPNCISRPRPRITSKAGHDLNWSPRITST